MITVEPLRQDHLAHFVPVEPFGDMPEYQFGNAAAFLNDGNVAAICRLFDYQGIVEVGLSVSRDTKVSAISAHRLARQMIDGLNIIGYRHLRAHTVSPVTSKWLSMLNFSETSQGVFERWL